MSKYVIEIKPEYEDKFKGVMILGAENSNLYVDSNTVDELEELNSDYINEHFGELQQDAYDRGYKDGRNVTETQAHDDAYQRGLDDAWEAAKKIANMWTRIGNNELLAIFGITERIGHSTIRALFEKQTANEAMLELEAYEEKQKQTDDEIKVGDIVERYLNGKLDSTGIYLGEDGDYWNCLFWTGAVFGTFAYPKNQFKKTEKHVDIDKILEGLRYDS